MCILCERRRDVFRRITREASVLTAAEKARLVSSLQERLRDVLEVVPAGQPATRLRHDATDLTAYAAPGVSVAVPRVGRAGSGDRPTSTTNQEER